MYLEQRHTRILLGLLGLFLVLAAGVLVYLGVRDDMAPSRSVRGAIASGRMLVSGAEDFDRYFILLPPHEARDLLATSRARGESRILFPSFSVGSEPSFEVVETSDGDLHQLALRGLPLGTRFPSLFDGSLVFYDRATSVAFADGLGSDADGFLYTIRFVRTLDATGTPLGTYGTLAPVAIGSPIGVLESSRTLDIPGVPIGSQAVFALKRGERDTQGASLSNLIVKNGRIVFVAPPSL